MRINKKTEKNRIAFRLHLPPLVQDFLCCGVAGWCLEVIFTSVDSMMSGDMRLMGHTSLLMFPIYGLGALLVPVSRMVDGWLTGLPLIPQAGSDELSLISRSLRHGLIYMVLIFLAEYIAGMGLKALGICPWDYSMWPDQVAGVIRLHFAPLWFGTGLLFEFITMKREGGRVP